MINIYIDFSFLKKGLDVSFKLFQKVCKCAIASKCDIESRFLEVCHAIQSIVIVRNILSKIKEIGGLCHTKNSFEFSI